MYLLDTSTIIEILKASDAGAKALLTMGESEVAITSPTRFELLVGDERPEETKLLIRNLPIIDFDQDAADNAAKIYNDLVKKGQTINRFDAMISAIAIQHDATIVTFDSHFTRVPGLKCKLLSF